MNPDPTHPTQIHSIQMPGSQGAVIAPQAPVHQEFKGPTPEQLRGLTEDAIARALQLEKARRDALRATVGRCRAPLADMSAYKGAHDLLQEVELAYRAVRPQICDLDAPLPAEQIRWQSVAGSKELLVSFLSKFVQFLANSPRLQADTADLAADLAEVISRIVAAHEQRDPAALDTALADVASMVATQSSRMNDRLIGAMRAFDLPGLVTQMQALWEDRPQASTEPVATALAPAPPGLAALAEAAAYLERARETHDQLQQLDNQLRHEEARSSAGGRGLRERWERSLARKIRQVLAALPADLSQPLEGQVTRCESAFATVEPMVSAESFREFRGGVIRVFNQVDAGLRRACENLLSLGGPLDELMQRLA